MTQLPWVDVPIGVDPCGLAGLAYTLHVLGCDDLGMGEDAVEWCAVGVIRMIRAAYAVAVYVG